MTPDVNVLVAASRSDHPHHVDALLAAPGVERPALGAERPAFRQLCADNALAANDVPDAWLAAAVIHQGEHLVSFDSDFRRLLSRAQFTRLQA
ncbi:hypothetical protein [Variovorax sp. J31P207]|uniref:hypothetical protein n=1 Tax=Variovorax sp. J31P207 TaxID=3053510 RepID=UPI0025779A2D|nr:hypothetical protein [Variovorax sp. J31P207]MDM0065400.1 hypothetical protein [Variovorax sp. J31P207]